MHASHAYWPTILESEEKVVDGEMVYSGVSLLDPKVCSAILCNYSKLKASGDGNFMTNTWYIMEDFDNLCTRALRDYPLYDRLVEYKIDGMQNIDI